MSFHLGGVTNHRHRVEEFSASCVPLSWRVRLWYDTSVNHGISTLLDIQELVGQAKAVCFHVFKLFLGYCCK